MNTQNNTALSNLLAAIANGKTLAKAHATAAKATAPKGEKMAAGQHASATVTAQIAVAIMEQAPQLGFAPAAGAVKLDKAGNVKEMTVTYRVAQTLEQRVATYKNAAARRAEVRAAAKAAKAAAVTPITATGGMAALVALQQKAA